MTTGKEFRRRRRRALRAVAMAILACAAFAPSALRADYQYIVSGWPAANESQSAQSPAVALETGMLATRSSAASLEARFRTSCVSDGHVQPVSAFMLIIR